MKAVVWYFAIALCAGICCGSKEFQDYSDDKLDELYRQWEESDEDKLEPDELPVWEREPPKIDPADIDSSDPDSMIKVGKKGRQMRFFARHIDDLDEEETERATAFWETDLFNAGIRIMRHVIDRSKIMLTVEDGSQAISVRDYLLTLPTCRDVTISGKSYESAAYKRKKMQKKKEEL